MGKEIERKYLIDKEKWNALAKPKGKLYRQGYISTNPEKTIRVRLTEDEAFLTIKGIAVGAMRLEYEYKIPLVDANELLENLTESELSKIRYKIIHQGKTWEVDEFLGDNSGLIVAEIELTTENEYFERPDWILTEVTDEARYYNSNLTIRPFKTWNH